MSPACGATGTPPARLLFFDECDRRLVGEGFVRKTAGRSARVVTLSEHEVLDVYQLRSGLEGLAARLIVEEGGSFEELTTAIETMRAAAVAGDFRALVESDLEFHLALC